MIPHSPEEGGAFAFSEWLEIESSTHTPETFTPADTKPRSLDLMPMMPVPDQCLSPWIQDLFWQPVGSSRPFKQSSIQLVMPAELQTLRQSAYLAEEQRRQEQSSHQEKPTQPSFPEHVGNYAAPLSPLRERDLIALDDLFQRDDMIELETDVNQMLLHLLPEPCWEEDIFDGWQKF